jgi:hypothetical protein
MAVVRVPTENRPPPKPMRMTPAPDKAAESQRIGEDHRSERPRTEDQTDGRDAVGVGPFGQQAGGQP